MISRVTRQKLANAVVSRWNDQYTHYISNDTENRFSLTYAKLKSIPNDKDGNTSIELVNFIIGNTSWTDIECSLCKAIVDEATAINPYDKTYYVCDRCVDKLHSFSILNRS